MDMHEAQRFSPSGAVPTAPGTAGMHPPSVAAGPLVVICLVLSSLAWVFVSYWSVSSVAYGIESAKLFPPSFGKTEVWLFALALQTVVSLFGLVLHLFFRRWALLLGLPLVIAVYLLINGFEGYHGVLAQHKSSIAPALLAQERAEIDSLSRRITTASAQVSEVYKQKLDAYSSLADDAAKGRDESGVAKCDTICKQYRRNYATAKSRFSHLALAAAPAPAFDAAQVDPRALLTDAVQRSDKLHRAGQDLAAFYTALDQSSPPAVLAQEINAIHSAAQAKEKRFAHLHSLSPFTLALDQTNQAFADAWAGRLPAVESRLPLVYGLLPALAVLALSVMIRACLAALGPGHYGLGHSLFDWASQGLQAKILPKVDALSARNFMNRVRIRTRSWMGT